MTRRRLRATTYGSVAGALIGLVLLVFWTGDTALESIEGLIDDGIGRSDFMTSSGGMYVLAALSSAIGGLAITAITYTLGREADPDGSRFPLGYLLPVGVITSVIVGYALLRAGLGLAADIEEGVVVVSVFRMTIIAAVAGAGAGGITARVVHTLSRPAFLALEGEAWPASGRAVTHEMMRAVGGPTIALLTVAVLAIAFSQLLLTLGGAAVVAVFGVVGGIVLFGAALIAYRPWDNAGKR